MKKEDFINNNKPIDENVAKIVNKVVENDLVPKEVDKNHVLGGRLGGSVSYSFYNPHNARFYFDFQKWNFKPDMLIFKKVNSSELSIECFDCRFVVKKSLIEVTNKISKERRFKIEGSANQRSDSVKEAVAMLEREAINVLKQFIIKFGGSSSFRCVKSWIPDNKILHDEIIDSLPLQMTFRNDVVKKVYNDVPSNVEFSDPVYAANYFRNAGLRDFVPEISSRLDSISGERQVFNEALSSYADNIKKHLEVMDNINLGIKELRDSVHGLAGNGLRSDPPLAETRDERLNKSGGSIPSKPISSHSTGDCSRSCSPLFDTVMDSVDDVSRVKFTPKAILSPETLSKDDINSNSKKYRLYKARKLLEEYGWSKSVW